MSEPRLLNNFGLGSLEIFRILGEIDIPTLLEEEKMQQLASNFKMVDIYSNFLNRSITYRSPYLELKPCFSYESSMFRQMINYFGSLHKLPQHAEQEQKADTLQTSPTEIKLEKKAQT